MIFKVSVKCFMKIHEKKSVHLRGTDGLRRYQGHSSSFLSGRGSFKSINENKMHRLRSIATEVTRGQRKPREAQEVTWVKTVLSQIQKNRHQADRVSNVCANSNLHYRIQNLRKRIKTCLGYAQRSQKGKVLPFRSGKKWSTFVPSSV